jgi:hypothetical protein
MSSRSHSAAGIIAQCIALATSAQISDPSEHSSALVGSVDPRSVLELASAAAPSDPNAPMAVQLLLERGKRCRFFLLARVPAAQILLQVIWYRFQYRFYC